MRKNIIFDYLVKARNGHYVHALEVSSLYELKEIISQLVDEFKSDYSDEEIKEFFDSISIYALEDEELTEQQNKENEEEIYNFIIDEYLTELL